MPLHETGRAVATMVDSVWCLVFVFVVARDKRCDKMNGGRLSFTRLAANSRAALVKMRGLVCPSFPLALTSLSGKKGRRKFWREVVLLSFARTTSSFQPAHESSLSTAFALSHQSSLRYFIIVDIESCQVSMRYYQRIAN